MEKFSSLEVEQSAIDGIDCIKPKFYSEFSGYLVQIRADACEIGMIAYQEQSSAVLDKTDNCINL